MAYKRILFFGAALLLVLLVTLETSAAGSSEEEETDEELQLNIMQPKRPNVRRPNFSERDQEVAKEKSRKFRERKAKLEKALRENKIVLKKGCPGFRNSAFRQPRKSALRKGQEASEALSATIALARRKKLSRRQRRFGIVKITLPDTSFSTSCFKKPKCNFKSPYRTIDGSCNNRKHTKWGQAENSFIRSLLPDYANGISTPRVSSDGLPLPSAKLVSRVVTSGKSCEIKKLTHMVMQWGQFVDHDITFTPLTSSENFTITCCNGGPVGQYRSRIARHPDCFPIEIPETDRLFKKFGVTCMEFIRSLASPRRDCTFGPREQMNQITAYIDGSNVYGSDDKEAAFLREFKGGRLRYSNESNAYFLPRDPSSDECGAVACFKAGDERANEQPNLALMHTVWLRHHNHLAKLLAGVNPHWKDEKLYLEARKIVGAQLQHITYYEWLPIILGKPFCKKNKIVNLNNRKKLYSKSYDENIDASIGNAFATAAFRFGHSLIQGRIEGYNSKNKRTKNLRLSEFFFNANFLINGTNFDQMIRGLARQKVQKFDTKFTNEVTGHLFAEGRPFGLDLIALNIQRGRDHGLPSYTRFRELCGFGKVSKWKDLKKDIKGKNLKNLKKVYRNVKDIDLFAGGVSETPKSGALIGRTFRCLVGEQFKRLKVGDRFWYENGGNKSKKLKRQFTKAQLKEIKKTRLSTILCENSKTIERLQKNVFKRSTSTKNVKHLCSDEKKFPRLDLSKWKEEL